MKRIILPQLVLLSAISAFAQGTVHFNNRLSGTSHVYAPLNVPFDISPIQGNGSNDTPPGSTDYGGRFAIGAVGTGGQYGAATTLAMLLGAPGSNAPESSLVPQSGPPSSFRTGTASGAVADSIATFNNIPPDAPVASFEMVAWDNSSGLYPTWSLASVAWMEELIAAGKSTEFVLPNVGGQTNSPPILFPGVTSFDMYFVFTPEPNSAAFAGLGAAAWLIFRRVWNRSRNRL
jgi:hypothetical protein